MADRQRTVPVERRRRDGELRARRGGSLTWRILAVNLVALLLMGASLLYLDSYRKQLLAERFRRAGSEAEITADALARAPFPADPLIAAIATRQHLRLRLFDRTGHLETDSVAIAVPSVTFANPADDDNYKRAARFLDRGMDRLLNTPAVPAYREPASGVIAGGTIADWPEAAEAARSQSTQVREYYAPDRTPVITAATPVGRDGAVLLTLRHAPDITRSVRDARQTLGLVVAAALILSILLSLFLARTIVQPLRLLVSAAIRVRLGRDRAVIVPRLPDRGDEIGLLARTISDMTGALRERIDAVESFAADVAHEIKNPLASLRSALESLDKVEDAGLRRQLADIAAHDVQRIDRLITEIAEASRIDAELSRTAFVRVDLLTMVSALVGARQRRGVNAHATVRIVNDGTVAPVVAGDPARLERVFENLLDNAVSFSPPGGLIEVVFARHEGTIAVEIRDQGPGIPLEARERVFERFHSLRPADEDFGSHSGLGLAIARTIVEAHDGTLTAHDPAMGKRGARLVAMLPAWGGE